MLKIHKKVSNGKLKDILNNFQFEEILTKWTIYDVLKPINLTGT